MPRRIAQLETILNSSKRASSERTARPQDVSRGKARRTGTILHAAGGMNNCRIAETVGVTRQTVRTWCDRFVKLPLYGLTDRPPRGTPRKIDDDHIEAIVGKTLETKPNNATRGSTHSKPKASGVSRSLHLGTQHIPFWSCSRASYYRLVKKARFMKAVSRAGEAPATHREHGLPMRRAGRAPAASRQGPPQAAAGLPLALSPRGRQNSAQRGFSFACDISIRGISICPAASKCA
jgi:hypothetical protein